jgi:hypothetical protein
MALSHVLVLFMADATDMTERHGRILAELSELGLALARGVQAQALAADDPASAADLSLAFHRVSRSVRQTLALEARLERDRNQKDREDRAEAAREAERRVQHRKSQVRMAVERLVWNEAEDDEAERLLAELENLLDEEALSDNFTEAPLDVHIARICKELGLAAPPDRADTAWRSSA